VLDLWPETLTAVGAVHSPAVLRMVGHLVSYIYKRCDLVLVQSRAFVDNIRTYAGGTERIRYFPGWSESLFKDGLHGVEPAAEMSDHGGEFNIMFAGNIGEAQDFPAILDAAERVRDDARIRWLIVGDGRAAAWLKSSIRERGLESSVRMLGRHPMSRMPEFFRGAQALLVSLRPDPVFNLTIPGKVQTYLATGVPIVGMLDGEGARVIEESGAGLVCAAGDADALAANVVRLADASEADRAIMGLNARAYAAREFDLDRLLDQLEGWMRELSTDRDAEPRS
jgi:glycosyltransferase involved in cell wall biosynthesis